MTAHKKISAKRAELAELLKNVDNYLKVLMRESIARSAGRGMTEALGAASSERAEGQLGDRAGYYGGSLVTRIGELDRRVPSDREGRFSTELLERYQRSEKALVSALAEMVVQGVSTRKAKTITEELCDGAFSASLLIQVNNGLDASLKRFAERMLIDIRPSLILDGRYEKVCQVCCPAKKFRKSSDFLQD